MKPSKNKKNKNKGNYDLTKWKKKLKRVPCFILGNAPSLSKHNLSLLDNYFTIGINRIFYVYDPTILVWQDLALWAKEKDKVKKTKALKYCRIGSHPGNKKYYSFRLEGRDSKMATDPSVLYGRGSSGAIAFQLAYTLRCDPIILVGMDCKNDKKGNTDFYGKNPMHRSHTLPFCVKALRFIKAHQDSRKIINCSKNKVFEERYSLEEAIEMLNGEGKYTREEIKNKLLK
jgi:hypothetical protein